MEKRLIEACHYYESVGMTRISLLGEAIVNNIKQVNDKTMNFIDDVHTYEEAPDEEKRYETTNQIPAFDFLVYESTMHNYALAALETLKGLSNKKRAKSCDGMEYFCSGFAVTNKDGTPACVLLDLGLCFYKKELGFTECINILPIHYEEQQKNLHRLIKKALKNFQLTTLLYDSSAKIIKEIKVEV